MNPHLHELGAVMDAAIIRRVVARRSYVVRSCTSKRRYDDKKAAVSHINLMLRHGRGNTRHLRAYPCEECHGYHITKDEPDE